MGQLGEEIARELPGLSLRLRGRVRSTSRRDRSQFHPCLVARNVPESLYRLLSSHVLGLALKFESRQRTEFATDGATLALHLTELLRMRGIVPLALTSGPARFPAHKVPDPGE